jgi:EmrB/QacA subfamily drug resistance transporter
LTESPARPPFLAIAGVLVALFLSAIDSTIVNTAMPVVVSSIGGMELYPWTFSGFMLASTVVMPFFGKFADLVGVRRCLIAAIAVFILGSAACGAAPTMGWLVAARALQGLGAGGITTLTFVAFGQLFPPETRGRAQGLVSMVWGVSSLLGPLAGGLIVTWAPWPWVFWVNVPTGALALAFIVWAYPRVEAPHRPHRISALDGVLLIGGLAALLSALSAPTDLMLRGSARAAAAYALVGVGALGWFVRRQLRAEEPLVPLDVFRNPIFALSSAIGVGACFTMFAALTYVPLMLQGAWGRSAPEAGAAMTPMMLAWPLSATLAGFAVNRAGFRVLVVAGTATMALGYALLWRGFGDGSVPLTSATSALLGAGMGFVAATTLVAAQVAVPRRVIGTASATLALTRNLGAAVGVLTMGVIQLAGFLAAQAAFQLALGPDQIAALVQPGTSGAGTAGLRPEAIAPAREALETSIRGVFGVSLGVSLVTVVLAAFLPGISPAEAARRAEEA